MEYFALYWKDIKVKERIRFGHDRMAVVMMGSGEKKPIFHDFLGMSCEEASVPVPATTNATAAAAAAAAAWEKGEEHMAPELEASFGASSGVLGLITGCSDLRSERQGVNNSEVFHFHGRKNATLGPELSTRLSGRKRSISDSANAAPINEWMLPVGSDSLESLQLMKVLGKDVVSEPTLGDGLTMFSMQPPPRPSSVILHPPPISGLYDSLMYKWERSAPASTRQMMHHRSRMIESGTVEKPSASFAYEVARPSQVAADEGSRIGIGGCETSNVPNPDTGAAEKNSSMVLPCSSRPNTYRSTALAGRQMTIFYAGQVHVFDNVHPTKADLIMALAGSIGGSWSTTYSPKPTTRVPARVAEAPTPSRDGETGNLFGQATRHFHGGHLIRDLQFLQQLNRPHWERGDA